MEEEKKQKEEEKEDTIKLEEEKKKESEITPISSMPLTLVMIPDLDEDELAMLPPIPGTFKMPLLQPGLSKQASFGMPMMTRLPSIGVRTKSQRET